MRPEKAAFRRQATRACFAQPRIDDRIVGKVFPCDWEYNQPMLVNISVNRLNNGRVQICIAKPQANPSPVQTYASIEAARCVLLDFGINDKEVDSTLKLLPEIEPQEVLRFSAMEVSQSLLEKHGYKLSAR